MASPIRINGIRYLSAICFGLVAACSAAQAQTAGSAVTLYLYGKLLGIPSAPLSVAQNGPITPGVCSTTTVTTGGTAVAAVGGIVNGARISNPIAATETLFINMAGTATTTQSGATEAIPPGGVLLVPGASTLSVTVNAVTSGHVFSCVKW